MDCRDTMKLKLNNDGPARVKVKKDALTIKEERRRTGRYIAILVGICLLLLAIYHAWVRRIPVVASLVVPALIMFIYVGWVLYSANREKHRRMDLEAALDAAALKESQDRAEAKNRDDHSSGRSTPRPQSPEDIHKHLTRVPSNLSRITTTDCPQTRFIKPIILVNDRPPDDEEIRVKDERLTHVVDVIAHCEKFKEIKGRRKFKRKFCRSKRNAAFKRSYSIA